MTMFYCRFCTNMANVAYAPLCVSRNHDHGQMLEKPVLEAWLKSAREDGECSLCREGILHASHFKERTNQ